MFKGSIFKVALVFSFIVICFFDLSQLFSQSKINSSSQKIIPIQKNWIPHNLQKETSNDLISYIAINQCKMYFSNNGMGSYNVLAGTSGFSWPGGENGILTSVFEDGFLFGGLIADEPRIGGSTYRYGLQAGKILSNGKADDPSLSKYRIYKIRKNWEQLPVGSIRSSLEKDYNEWPVEDGAPWIDNDKDGIYNPKYDEPAMIGDETNWFVMNDLDASRTTFLFGSYPTGLEIQCTIWGYKLFNFLDDVIFKKYKVINKGEYFIKNMYFAYWSDTDLGYTNDDFIGCDTILSLGYCYNGDYKDEGYYDTPPPAVGYKILQGPIKKGSENDSARFDDKFIWGYKNINLIGFYPVFPQYWPPFPIFPDATEIYNNIRGHHWDGTIPLNPITNQYTPFVLSGDPENKTGWYEGKGWPNGPAPDDRKFYMGSGPFNFAIGDTQEFVIAIIMARGNNHLNSITHLKRKAEAVQLFYDNYIVQPLKRNFDKPEVTKFGLGQNYPNPFNASTIMKYAIPIKSKVTIKVFDVIGNEISTLVNEEKEAGEYNVTFDANNLPSGVYFCNFYAREIASTKKLIVLK